MSFLAFGDIVDRNNFHLVNPDVRSNLVILDNRGSRKIEPVHHVATHDDDEAHTKDIHRRTLEWMDEIYLNWEGGTLWPPGTLRIGEYLNYYNPDEYASSSPDPVNPWPWFLQTREHLAQMAHDFLLDHGFEDGTLTDTETRGWMNHLIAQGDYARRNKVTSHWFPEMLGMCWRLLHEFINAHPDAATNPDWQTPMAEVAAIIEPFCEKCSGGSRLRHIKRHLDIDAWEEKLEEGYRLLPDFSSKPWGIQTIDVGHGANSYFAELDRRNFLKATDWHGDRDIGEPDIYTAHRSEAEVLPDTGAYSVIAGSDFANRSFAIETIQHLYYYVLNHRESSDELIRCMRRYSEMWLLALNRLENWPPIREGFLTEEIIHIYSISGRFLMDPNNEIHQAIIERWGDVSFHQRQSAWRHGFLTLNGNRLEEDFVPYDPNFPWTRDEAYLEGDDRRRSRFVVVGVDEIDEDAMGPNGEILAASVKPWAEEAERMAWVESVIGPDPAPPIQ